MKKMVMSVATLLLLVGAFTSCNFSDHSKIKKRLSAEDQFASLHPYTLKEGKDMPTFYLWDGDKQYDRVLLIGNFESADWSKYYALTYNEENGFWETYKQFKAGTYLYKFRAQVDLDNGDVQDYYMLDPYNKRTVTDGEHTNNVYEVKATQVGELTPHEEGYTLYWYDSDGDIIINPDVSIPMFYLEDKDAVVSTVAVAGEFNGWDENSDFLVYIEDTGYWELDLDTLPPGKYKYKFVLDGTDWEPDYFANELTEGGADRNSIITIPQVEGVDHHELGYDGDVVPMFYLYDEYSEYFDGDVAVIGEFNGWAEPIYLEFNDDTGYWELNLEDLEPGEYEYKLQIYEVDGLDMNASFTRNGNSVLVVK